MIKTKKLKNNNKLFSILIIIILLILSGTYIIYSYNSNVEAINSIKINLDDISIQDISISDFKLKLFFNFSNPSNITIYNLKSNFDIFISDEYIGKGNFSNLTIPAKSNYIKDISITIYYSGLAEAAVDVIKNVLNSQKFNLNVEGEISSSILFDLISVSEKYKLVKSYLN
jgi:hypothetical protein